MAFMDDPASVLRHLHYSWTTSDDSGMSSLVLQRGEAPLFRRTLSTFGLQMVPGTDTTTVGASSISRGAAGASVGAGGAAHASLGSLAANSSPHRFESALPSAASPDSTSGSLARSCDIQMSPRGDHRGRHRRRSEDVTNMNRGGALGANAPKKGGGADESSEAGGRKSMRVVQFSDQQTAIQTVNLAKKGGDGSTGGDGGKSSDGDKRKAYGTRSRGYSDDRLARQRTRVNSNERLLETRGGQGPRARGYSDDRMIRNLGDEGLGELKDSSSAQKRASDAAAVAAAGASQWTKTHSSTPAISAATTTTTTTTAAATASGEDTLVGGEEGSDGDDWSSTSTPTALSDTLDEEVNSSIFQKRQVDTEPTKRISKLSLLMKAAENVVQNPFTMYSRHRDPASGNSSGGSSGAGPRGGGAGGGGRGAGGIDEARGMGMRRRVPAGPPQRDTNGEVRILFPFAIGERSQAPLYVRATPGATVEQVIGLIMYLYTAEERTPSIAGMTVDRFSLRLVEDDGEPDEDFPALERGQPFQKFRFPELALCDNGAGSEAHADGVDTEDVGGTSVRSTAPSTLSGRDPAKVVVRVHLPNEGTSTHFVNNMDTPLSEIVMHVVKKRMLVPEQHALELPKAPGVELDLRRTLNDVKSVEFNLIHKHSKRRDIEYEEEDSNIDFAENVAGALQLHQLKNFKVFVRHKFTQDEEVIMGIDSVRISFVSTGSSRRANQTIMMEDVVSCTLSGPKAPNLFRLAYFSTDVVKHLDFAAKSPEDAREIEAKIQTITFSMPSARRDAWRNRKDKSKKK